MRQRWLDVLVAFAALFVSVVSLAVAMRTADANTRLVSASSWPFLSYGAGIVTVAGVPRIHMKVGNAGVGPAKIESAELVWKGTAYRRDEDFLKACCGADPASKIKFDSSLLPHEVLRAGDTIEFLGLAKSADPGVFDALQRAMFSRDLQINVCYCSIFDECWKMDLTTLTLKPDSVPACVQPKVTFDEGLLGGKP